MDISSPWMFQYKVFSAQGQKDFLAPWTWTMDTWTFRHSSTGAEISVLKCPYCFERCQNIHVLKCLGVKISHVQCPWYVLRIPCVKNVHVPKCLQGRNMHLPKYPGDEMSMLKWWEV